jgi:hypothetical protein
VTSSLPILPSHHLLLLLNLVPLIPTFINNLRCPLRRRYHINGPNTHLFASREYENRCFCDLFRSQRLESVHEVIMLLPIISHALLVKVRSHDTRAQCQNLDVGLLQLRPQGRS